MKKRIFNPYYREKVYKTKNAEFNVFEQVLENVFQYEEQIIEHIKKSSKFLNFDEVYELGTPEYLERYLNDKSHTS